jgi:hypothetical protein
MRPLDAAELASKRYARAAEVAALLGQANKRHVLAGYPVRYLQLADRWARKESRISDTVGVGVRFVADVCLAGGAPKKEVVVELGPGAYIACDAAALARWCGVAND